MPKIIICQGTRSSGKTDWTKQWVLEDPEHRVRFSDDDIRNMLGKHQAHNNTVDELRSLGKLSPQDDIRYSIEYKDSIVPLQESTDEDATTATYKKTYKFIGIW